MHYDLIHPRDQIVMLMQRVYRYGMTTTSGGNMSIRDDNGDLWITPAGVDKGSLQWEDIVRVQADGTSKGRHRPSSEFPFHRAIYEARPDLGGIVHAHPSSLVAFSIVRQMPPVQIIPQAQDVCGRLGYAPYALPGSAQLGRNIAETFKQGYDCVLMENHGVVCAGADVLRAFQRFETLDFCARLAIRASILGKYRELTPAQISLFRHTKNYLPEFEPARRTSEEKALRRHVCEIVHRAYDQQLMTSTEGVVSVRLAGSTFLITPTGVDRRLLERADIVLVSDCRRERGKLPSRSVLLHDRIYRDHPRIQAIVSAQAPSATAFAVCGSRFDTRTIPESYILLRDVQKIAYGPQFTDEGVISDTLSDETPVVLLENDAILTTGTSLLEAFDRLEVAEFSARSLIDATRLGSLVAMDEASIAELKAHFLTPKKG